MKEYLLIGCGVLKTEIDYIINKNKWPVKTFFLESSLHINFDKLEKELLNAIKQNRKENIIVFYGACHPLIDKYLKEENTLRTQGQNCIEILLGKERYFSELEKGAFFLLNDWLKNWKDVMGDVFNSNEIIKEIFKSERKYILAIDTKCSMINKKEAAAFAEISGLPINWTQSDLYHLELTLLNLILNKENFYNLNYEVTQKKLDDDLLKKLNRLSKEKADIQIILDLIKSLNQNSGLENLINSILFDTLSTIGGRNIILYYKFENNYYSKDIYGNDTKSNEILDCEVEDVIKSGELKSVIIDSESSLIDGLEYSKTFNVIYPLKAGKSVFGALKIDSITFNNLNVSHQLITYIDYISIAIKNELNIKKNLDEINRKLVENNLELSNEVEKRKEIEKELLITIQQVIDANKTKSLFLATMSHEIRTPMNGMIGFLELLKMSSLNTDQIEYVDSALESGEILLRVINDILDMSKIESGKLELEMNNFDLKKSILITISNIKPIVIRKGLQFKLDIKIKDYIVIGDKIRLNQILLNLLNNAVKFTNEGYIGILIELLEESDEFIILKFDISDSGIGIENDKIDKLFKVFSQIDNNYNRSYEGSGLGLAISKNLVNLMGGKIWVESKKEIGSKFIFTLKLKKVN